MTARSCHREASAALPGRSQFLSVTLFGGDAVGMRRVPSERGIDVRYSRIDATGRIFIDRSVNGLVQRGKQGLVINPALRLGGKEETIANLADVEPAHRIIHPAFSHHRYRSGHSIEWKCRNDRAMLTVNAVARISESERSS